jgi:hypothetical protein
MCGETICLEPSPAVRLYARRGDCEVLVGLIDGRPFAAYVVDRRSGEHLHFPADDVLGLLKAQL